jgi:hypothetical protein
MAIADIIAASANGTRLEANRKQASGIIVNSMAAAPAGKAVDEPLMGERQEWTPMPVDTGKMTTEVLPGLLLTRYSRGYVSLRLKGIGHHGRKVSIGRPLYRKEVTLLIDALMAEVEKTKTYEEANGLNTLASSLQSLEQQQTPAFANPS